MTRNAGLIIAALALVGLGWIVGIAQSSSPDFELIVNAPSGQTTVECVRGCKLSWVERGLNPNAAAIDTFEFMCTAERCSSGKVGGWLAR
jgi:hypothetical protein